MIETLSLTDVAAMVNPDELAAIVTDLLDTATQALDGDIELPPFSLEDMSADLEVIRDDLDVPEALRIRSQNVLARIHQWN